MVVARERGERPPPAGVPADHAAAAPHRLSRSVRGAPRFPEELAPQEPLQVREVRVQVQRPL